MESSEPSAEVEVIYDTRTNSDGLGEEQKRRQAQLASRLDEDTALMPEQIAEHEKDKAHTVRVASTEGDVEIRQGLLDDPDDKAALAEVESKETAVKSPKNRYGAEPWRLQGASLSPERDERDMVPSSPSFRGKHFEFGVHDSRFRKKPRDQGKNSRP